MPLHSPLHRFLLRRGVPGGILPLATASGRAVRLSLSQAAADCLSNPAKVARQQKNRLAAAFLLFTIDDMDVFFLMLIILAKSWQRQRTVARAFN